MCSVVISFFVIASPTVCRDFHFIYITKIQPNEDLYLLSCLFDHIGLLALCVCVCVCVWGLRWFAG